MSISKTKEPSESPNAQELGIKKLEAWGALIKALIWPVIFIVFFALHCNSFRDIIKQIPNKIKASNKISVGSLSFEISEKAKQIGNPELGELTKDLSGKAIEELLLTGSHIMTYPGKGVNYNEITFPTGEKKDALTELAEKKLIIFSTPMDQYEKFINSLESEKVVEPYDTDRIKYIINPNQLQKNLREIESQNYRLTETGIKVFQLVIEAIKSNVQSDEKD